VDGMIGGTKGMTLDDSPGELRDSGEFFWRGFGIDAGGGPGVSSETDITALQGLEKSKFEIRAEGVPPWSAV